MKECPKCKIINPESALRCDCGYDFSAKAIKESYLNSSSTKSNDINTPRQTKRPKSVTVIAWVQIVLAIVLTLFALSQVQGLRGWGNLEMRGQFMQLAIAVLIASMFQLAIGVGMLNGKNWARLLYFWLVPINVITGLLMGTLSGGVIVQIILYIIFVIFLTRSNVVAYFEDWGTEKDRAKTRSTVTRLFDK